MRHLVTFVFWLCKFLRTPQNTNMIPWKRTARFELKRKDRAFQSRSVGISLLVFLIGNRDSEEEGEERERESGHGKRKAPTAPQSSRGGSRGTKLHHLGQPVQIQHNFSFDLHFPYFPELRVVYRVRRIFALTWSNPVLWEPPKVSQGLREFQKPHFQSTVGFVCFTVVGAYVGGAKQHC